jgi:hypothetical protein
VDGQLAADCPGTYDPAARSCGSGTAKAFNSLQEAADIANPGDQILLRGGTIQGAVLVRRSGTASQPIAFQPYNSEKVIIQLGDLFTTWTQSNAGPGIWELDLTEAFARQVIRNPDYVKVVKRANYGIADAGTMDDLINAPVITTSTGKEIDLDPFDLAYFDQATKKLYLRLVNPSTWNPQNFFVFDASRRLETFGSYITFRDLTIQHGFEGIRTNAGTVGIKAINNTIQYMASNGVMQLGNDLLLDGNKVSYVGREVHAGDVRYGGSYKWGQVHGFYLTGDGGVVRNNILKECKGSCLHPWNADPPPRNFEIYNNVVEGGFQVSGENIFVHDNIFRGVTFPLAVQTSAGRNMRFWNNVLEAEMPLVVGYFGVVEGLEFKNNIVRATGGDFCVEINEANLPQVDFSNNYYTNCQRFGAGSGEGGDWRAFSGASAFADYVAELRKKDVNFESSSLTGPANWTPAFNPVAGSRVIDAGVCLPGLTKDRSGKARPEDGNGDGRAECDIGMYEWRPTSMAQNNVPLCVENWSCGAWSACGADRRQTRTCNDSKNCGTASQKPSLTRSCLSSLSDNNIEPPDAASVTDERVVTGGSRRSSSASPAASSSGAPSTSLVGVLEPINVKLALGSSGEPIKHLQTMLAQDATVYSGPIDGYYGAGTKEAVARFQAKHGIPTDASSRGSAGPLTRAKLNELYAGRSITLTDLPASQKQAVIQELQKRLVDLLEQVYAILAAQAR